MKNNKNIAVTIQNYVQFYSIKNVLDKLINEGVNIDFYVPIARDDWGLKEMFDDIYKYLKDNKYKVMRNPLNKKYKVLLEPYPMEYYFSFNYQYRLKYCYGLDLPKPSISYKEEDNIPFDEIFTCNTYQEKMLRNFTQSCLIGKADYYNFKPKSHKSKKKTLLYLPTYGESNSINDVVDELFKLKSKYHIIIKLHHGTNYFNYEESKKNKLESCFDECYDSKKPLKDLLCISDVVLSDNSGAILDAIYAHVPVLIFSKTINYFQYYDLKSYQEGLIKDGIIPFTDNSKKLDSTIEKALSSDCIKKQDCLREKIFPLGYNEGIEKYVNRIKDYLNDNIDKDFFKLHRIILNNQNDLHKNIENINNKCNDLTFKNEKLKQQLNNSKFEKEELLNSLKEYKNGRLYKLSSKLYSLQSKIIKK